MAFCPNCGASVEGRFCIKCGTAVAADTTGGAQGFSTAGAGAAPQQQPYSQAAPPATAGLTDNVAAVLCYVLGLITGIVFLVIAPYNQNKFVRFHAFQSIFFHVAFIAIWIVEGSLLAFILPWTVSTMLWTLTSLAALGIWILLLVKAYQGEKFKLPIVGDLADKQA